MSSVQRGWPRSLSTGRVVREACAAHGGVEADTRRRLVLRLSDRAEALAAAQQATEMLAPLVNARLRDPGEHRIKGLAAAKRVLQLGDASFRRSSGCTQTNMR
jgi:hypothetical protein